MQKATSFIMIVGLLLIILAFYILGELGLFILALGFGMIAASIYITLFADLFISKTSYEDVLDKFED